MSSAGTAAGDRRGSGSSGTSTAPGPSRPAPPASPTARTRPSRRPAAPRTRTGTPCAAATTSPCPRRPSAGSADRPPPAGSAGRWRTPHAWRCPTAGRPSATSPTGRRRGRSAPPTTCPARARTRSSRPSTGPGACPTPPRSRSCPSLSTCGGRGRGAGCRCGCRTRCGRRPSTPGRTARGRSRSWGAALDRQQDGGREGGLRLRGGCGGRVAAARVVAASGSAGRLVLDARRWPATRPRARAAASRGRVGSGSRATAAT